MPKEINLETLQRMAELATKNFDAELDKINSINPEDVEKLVQFAANYDLKRLLDSNAVSIKTNIILDRSKLDRETIYNWQRLDDADQIDPAEINTLLTACRSMHNSSKFMFNVRCMLDLLNKLIPYMIVICDLLEEE